MSQLDFRELLERSLHNCSTCFQLQYHVYLLNLNLNLNLHIGG